MKTANGINLTMLCDFYELTMGNGYFLSDRKDRISYFDVFFRRVPDAGGFAIAAGLEQIVSYIQNLHFDPEDIAYLRSRGIFDERFLSYLENFRFSGDIWAVPEGTPIFPGEPVITVRAPAIEAQLLETYMLLEFNHQSLIATKASRICRAAEGRTVLEFGSRRAQGIAGAVTGARAAFIGGCAGTACTVSDQIYGVPAAGTMAHSWVQMFDSEYEAFVHYCRTYPENAVLLVDTYDSLRSGVPNAIRAFDEILKPLGIKKCGIRFDSGDMAYLTKKARKMLDDAGWTECRITVSNSLDEHLIRDLIISENIEKITNPDFKKLYRFYDRETGKAEADYICLREETVADDQPLTICDPMARWKRKTMENYRAVELQVPVFRGGKLVYQLPTLNEIKAYCAKQIETLWPEVLRFENPHQYYVDLSDRLMALKDEMLHSAGKHSRR